MLVVGLSSGTSVDAVDVAVADLWSRHGADPAIPGEVHLRPLGHDEYPWPTALQQRIRALLPPAAAPLEEVCALDNLAGQVFAEAATRATVGTAGEQAELIVSHGQTVFHWVEGERCHGTLQLGQPAWIAESTGLPVVSDLRARDIAAGGQGAPLASILDALWLGGPDGPRAALNLGGIANITVVDDPPDDQGSNQRHPREQPAVQDRRVIAYDTGPGNVLLDLAALQTTGGVTDRDLDGHLAEAGTVRADLLDRLLAEPYYALAPPKSTGRELFHAGYLDNALVGLPEIGGANLLATLTELTAQTVADACHAHRVREVVASGGGVRNPALMAALRRRLGSVPLTTSDERGLPSDAKEAYLFALIGFLTWHQVPAVMSGATGARAPRTLGRITPGNAPMRLPDPIPTPASLTIHEGRRAHA